jgi:S1-C subfamily serine protease
MKRLAAIGAGAALVCGVSVAAIVIALTNGATISTAPAAFPAAAPVAGQAVAATTSEPSGPALSAETIYERDAPGVVVITATQTEKTPGTLFLPPTEQHVQVLGSGFVIDEQGDIVTNEHVVANASDVTVGFSSGATYPAKVVGADPSTDLAVVRVDAPAAALHPLRFAGSSDVRVGDRVYAIGNPFGLTETMTAGIVSATGRDIKAPNGLGIPEAIQTDAAINHGNSGGPLLDDRGDVIGINDQIESGGSVDGNVGVGFAIGSSTAESVLPQLIAQGHASHAWLGVEVVPVSQLAGDVHGLPSHGLLVVRVVAGSPAASARLEAASVQAGSGGERTLGRGDTIVAVNGASVDSPERLQAAVQAHKPGDQLRLTIIRGGRELTVTATLANAPSSS